MVETKVEPDSEKDSYRYVCLICWIPIQFEVQFFKIRYLTVMVFFSFFNCQNPPIP